MAAMIKQSGYSGVKRCVRFLPTISEETDLQALAQKGFANADEIPKETFRAMNEREKCNCNLQSPKDIAWQEITKDNDVLFTNTQILTDDSRLLLIHQAKASKLEDMNTARALFPDFFPRSPIQDSCDEDFSWKSKPTMEQIFSGYNNEPLLSCDQHENFEYWRKVQLSL